MRTSTPLIPLTFGLRPARRLLAVRPRLLLLLLRRALLLGPLLLPLPLLLLRRSLLLALIEPAGRGATGPRVEGRIRPSRFRPRATRVPLEIAPRLRTNRPFFCLLPSAFCLL